MRTEYKVIAGSIIFVLLFWVSDTVLDYLYFCEGSFLELLISDVPLHEIYIRSLVLVCFLAFGILMSRVIAERKQVEETLRRYADEQAALYAITSAAATILDPDEMLSTVLDVTLSVLGSHAGWVLLPGPTLDDPPHIVAWRGVPESFVAAERAIPLRTCPICAPLLADGSAKAQPQLVAECPRLPPEVLASADLGSHLCIPLSASGQVLGILDIAWRTSRLYSESDRALLMAIGQQVGMALRNAQLYHAARQVDRLRVLNELDQALAATLDLETAAEVTLRQIADAVDAPAGALFLLPPQAHDFKRAFTLEQGWTDTVVSEKRAQRLQAFLQWFQDGREAISLSSSDLTAIGGDLDLTQHWGPNSLVVPIRGDGKLVAVLVLGGRPADRPFTDEDRSLAQAAASHAGQVIQNTRLYQETVRRLKEAETLSTVTAALTRSLDLDQVLQSIVDSATCLIPASTSGVIHLADEAAGKLIPQATSSSGIKIQETTGMPIGKGVAGLAMQEKRLINVPNVEQDPRFLPFDSGTLKKSLLTAPLMIDGDCIGTLSLNSDQVGAFSADDERLLATLAAQATIAVRNARLHQKVQHRVEELVFLNRVGRAVTSSLNLEQVLATVMQEATDVLKVEAASVLLLDEEDKKLVFETVVGPQSEKVKGLRFSLGRGIAGWVVQHGQTVCVNDVRQDARFYEGIDAATGFETRSLLCAPLMYRERVSGVIEMVNKRQGEFSGEDSSLLEAVSSIAAAALENARLYTAVRARADELKALLREREQAQARLIHTEKMSALGRLAASLVHEINNPLQSVIGCLGLALEALAKGKNVNRYLQVAYEEVRRAARTVTQMRDLSKPKSGEKEPTDVNTLLEQVLELNRKRCQENRVEVIWRPVADLPTLLLMADQIKQVFLNLVLNAIESMPEGGRLQMSTAYTSQPAGVRIEFADGGVGIAPDDLPHIFEPFYSTKPKGTGLGLYISYGIVKQHGGSIEVESRVNEGSTFAVWLPA